MTSALSLGTAVVLGIDIGGSGCRIRLHSPAGPGATVHRVGRSVAGDGVDVDALIEQIRSGWDDLGRPGVDAVAVGMAGLLTLTADPAALQRSLARVCATPVVLLASDVLTSHVGALGLTGGVVVAAGTGAVALGTDLREQWHRSDGWGHLLGDEGSGAWIGAAGLRAALRAHDGRPDGSVPLLRRLTERWGHPDRLPAQLYPYGDVAARLAAFVPDVVAAADAGDTVSAALLTRAGQLLAETASSALAEDVPARVSWAGGLFQLPLVLDAFRAAVPPAFELIPPRGTSLDGAVLLASAAITDPARLPVHDRYLRHDH